jgi:hypothetical protein
MGWEEDHQARTAKFPDDVRAAHRHSSGHRAELLASENCGCFYCERIYQPSEIVAWTDTNESGEGQTAICPRCGIDSVIGDRSGFPVTPEFLAKMHEHWF